MGNRKTAWILAFALTLTLLGMYAERTEAASATITNGTDWLDTAGNPIHANSGNILKVGSTYYWYGEHAVSGKFDSVNVYTSTDLKNWTFRNAILTKDSATELASSKIERPKVIYNPSTGQYVLWAHYENGTDYSLARVAVATSSTPDGKFTYEGSFRPMDLESRDMTVFVDTDGTGYLLSASRKNGGANDTMALFKMNDSYTGVDSFEGWLFENAYREAPAVVKKAAAITSSPPKPPAGTLIRVHTPQQHPCPDPGQRSRLTEILLPSDRKSMILPPLQGVRQRPTSTWVTAGIRSTSANTSIFGCHSP